MTCNARLKSWKPNRLSVLSRWVWPAMVPWMGLRMQGMVGGRQPGERTRLATTEPATMRVPRVSLAGGRGLPAADHVSDRQQVARKKPAGSGKGLSAR